MKSMICLIIFHTALFGKKFLVEVENVPKKESKLSRKYKTEAGNDYMVLGSKHHRHPHIRGV